MTRVLTTSYETALKGDLNRPQAYIVRLVGIKKSDLSERVFYLSNDFDEVDYTAVDGVISRYGVIKQLVDYYNNSFSFGGFNIDVLQIQDKTNDIIKDYYFHNQQVEIYSWIEGQEKRTNQDMNFATAGLEADSNILDDVQDFEVEIKVSYDSVTAINQILLSNSTTTGWLFDYVSASSIMYFRLKNLGGGTTLQTFGGISFTANTQYVLGLKKIGTALTFSIDGVDETPKSITSTDDITVDAIGNYSSADSNYFDGNIYYCKMWTGGDRKTGTLVCDLVAHENDSASINAIDLSETHTFTKYGAGTITYIDNLQREYKGKIEKVPANQSIVSFKVSNDTRKLEQTFPPNITTATNGYAKGKISNRVYGTLIAPVLTDKDRTTNAVKAEYVGLVSGKYRWIVAGNGADVSANAGKVWFKDTNLNRFVEVVAFSTGTDADGNRYVDITPQDGFITLCYDYIHPYKVATGGGSPDFANTENAIDDDINSYSEVAFDNEVVSASLQLSFNNDNGNTINEKKVYYFCSQLNADGFTLTGYTTPASIDVSGGDGSTIITAGSPTTIAFNLTEVDGDVVGYGRVYMCYQRLEYELTQLFDLYVAGTNASVDDHKLIIEDICDELGVEHNISMAGIDMDFSIDSQKKAIEWIQEIARQGASVAYINSDNQLTLSRIDLTASVDKDFEVGDIDIGTLLPGETSIKKLVNDIIINYWADRQTDGFIEVEPDDNSDSDDIYGTWQKILDAFMYTDTPTALLEYIVNGTDETFFTKIRNTVEYETLDIRGINAYDGSGNFHPIAELVIGDIVSINAEMDDYIKCNGETWSGKKFIIVDFAKQIGPSKNNFKIKGIDIT